MNKLTPLWIGLGIIGVIVAGFVMALIGANNTANGYEQSINAAHEEGKNTLGQLAPKLREALGVTKLQTSALEEIITKANESRYGKTGSSATMQWISEQNPSLDQSSYGRIINMIEGARNDFAAAQKDKIDRIREYNTALGNFPGGFMMKLAGYPTQKYLSAHYDKIVISGHAAESFETGRDDGVNVSAF